jgi:hypothetical protein
MNLFLVKTMRNLNCSAPLTQTIGEHFYKRAMLPFGPTSQSSFGMLPLTEPPLAAVKYQR